MTTAPGVLGRSAAAAAAAAGHDALAPHPLSAAAVDAALHDVVQGGREAGAGEVAQVRRLTASTGCVCRLTASVCVVVSVCICMRACMCISCVQQLGGHLPGHLPGLDESRCRLSCILPPSLTMQLCHACL